MSAPAFKRIPARLTWGVLIGEHPEPAEVDLGFVLNPENGVAGEGGAINTRPNVWTLYLAARDLYEVAYLGELGQDRAASLRQPALAILREAGARLGDPWATPPELAPSSTSVAALQGPPGSTMLTLQAEANRLADLVGTFRATLGNWAQLPAQERATAKAQMLSILAEAADAAERLTQPLPLTDVCVCRSCKRVHLPTSPWGSPSYSCCCRFWSSDPRAGYGALSSTFWQKHQPGDRTSHQLGPELDGTGKSAMTPPA